MECTLCKIQYVDKIETPFNLRLNNHRSDFSDPNAIPACCHFAQVNHKFNTHATFILIETITNKSRSIAVIQDFKKTTKILGLMR